MRISALQNCTLKFGQDRDPSTTRDIARRNARIEAEQARKEYGNRSTQDNYDAYQKALKKAQSFPIPTRKSGE